jgi:hypothetical protein
MNLLSRWELLTAIFDQKAEKSSLRCAESIQLLINLLKNFPNVSSPNLGLETLTLRITLHVLSERGLRLITSMQDHLELLRSKLNYTKNILSYYLIFKPYKISTAEILYIKIKFNYIMYTLTYIIYIYI